MNTTIDYRDVEATARIYNNNWQDFECFALHDRESYVGFCIAYTHNRDSSLIEQCNAKVYAKELGVFGEDVRDISSSHWACGWIDGHAIRVYDAQGNVTDAFKKYCELQQQEADYPILDEDDYSDTREEQLCEYAEANGLDLNDDEQYNEALSAVEGW